MSTDNTEGKECKKHAKRVEQLISNLKVCDLLGMRTDLIDVEIPKARPESEWIVLWKLSVAHDGRREPETRRGFKSICRCTASRARVLAASDSVTSSSRGYWQFTTVTIASVAGHRGAFEMSDSDWLKAEEKRIVLALATPAGHPKLQVSIDYDGQQRQGRKMKVFQNSKKKCKCSKHGVFLGWIMSGTLCTARGSWDCWQKPLRKRGRVVSAVPPCALIRAADWQTATGIGVDLIRGSKMGFLDGNLLPADGICRKCLGFHFLPCLLHTKSWGQRPRSTMLKVYRSPAVPKGQFWDSRRDAWVYMNVS